MPLTITSEAVGAAVAASGLFAAGGALFVRLSINSALAAFQISFLDKLNGTYRRAGECGVIHQAETERLLRIEERLDEVV